MPHWLSRCKTGGNGHVQLKQTNSLQTPLWETGIVDLIDYWTIGPVCAMSSFSGRGVVSSFVLGSASHLGDISFK